MSATDTGPAMDPGDKLVLFVDEGDVWFLGLFFAEKSRESLPLPFEAVLLKLSTYKGLVCFKEKSCAHLFTHPATRS